MSLLRQWLWGHDDIDVWGDDSDSDDDDIAIIKKYLDALNDEEEGRERKRRNTGPRPGGSNATGRPRYWESVWGRMLREPALQVVESPARKVFRRRFRVPYPIFVRLVQWAKGWHERSKYDCCHRERCPTELKVLGYLRMVGRSACFDDVQELSRISASTMHAFFKDFSKKGREELFPIHVKMPGTVEELGEIEAAYAAIGLPGACGSMDVVHIALGACPHGIKNVCTGKEGYPTLAYNVICDHRGHAIAIMPGAYGTMNDKTIVKSDDAVERVRTDPLFTEYHYETRDKDGGHHMAQGAYLIVDGGYLRWLVLMCGLRDNSDPDYVEWRRKMESVRKDIECFFGRLKQRFKILRIPMLLTNKQHIDNMMFTIVAIQNMLLDYSIASEEITSWGVQLKWQKVDFTGTSGSLSELIANLALAEDEDVQEEADPRWFRPLVRKKVKRKDSIWKLTDDFHDPGKDFASVGLRGLSPTTFGWGDWGVPPKGEANGFHYRQKVLTEHYAWFHKHRPGAWMRS